jgi:hypothetical protein
MPPHEREIIDWLALILRPEIYVILHLPDPPPEILRTVVQDMVKGMAVAERKLALARVKNLAAYTNTVVQVLNSAEGAAQAA